MKKFVAYTLVEIVVVVIIISILLSITLSRYSYKSENRYSAENCINTIYGGISNFIYAARTSKVLDGVNAPSIYHITKSDQGSGSIELRYTMGNTSTGMFKGYDLANETLKCNKGQRYAVKINTGDLFIDFIAGTLSKGQEGSMLLKQNEGALIATGEVSFKLCQPSEQEIDACQDFARISFDRRTGLVTKSFCKQYTGDDNSKCYERSTG